MNWKRKEERNIPHKTLKALKLFSSSMDNQLRARMPLHVEHSAHVSIGPTYCAINPTASLPKKLPAMAMTSMYKAAFSSVPRRSRAYVGM